MGGGIPNFEPSTIWTNDNLPIMRGMNSHCVDLIYLDPPFNSNVNYAAPIGSVAAGAHFKDRWSLNDVKIAWVDIIDSDYPRIKHVLLACESDSMKSYLIYMAVRLIEMKRILRKSGSIYLHCDDTAGAHLRLLMDAIFGTKQFVNKIVWCYSGPGNVRKSFPKKHDTLLFYTNGGDYVFNPVFTPYSSARVMGSPSSLATGKRTREEVESLNETYLKRGKKIEDWWADIPSGGHIPKKERTGYPTQKPLALLERVIKASSNPGDLVFDPFCGCATTLVAADRLGRGWAGCDVSDKAAELVVQRIKQDQPRLLRDVHHRSDIPRRTDQGRLPDYRTHKDDLYGKQRGYCNGCQKHFEARHLEVDHKIARDSGGTDHIENLQLLCSHCNRVKGNRGQEYLINYLNMNKELLKQKKVW